jgi:hypothetical protein
MKTNFAACVLALALPGCATEGLIEGDRITPTELVQEAAERAGGTVEVSGYLVSGTDTRALWQTEAAHTQASEAVQHGRMPYEPYYRHCVTLFGRESDLQRLRGTTVRVTGTVEVLAHDDLRNLWACNAVSVHVQRVEPR